jgi:hypothetical protein
MKLGFYEKVLVTASRRFPEYVERVGVGLGISEDESKVYGYSVFLPGEAEGLSFSPDELRGSASSSTAACSMIRMSCASESTMERARGP